MISFLKEPLIKETTQLEPINIKPSCTNGFEQINGSCYSIIRNVWYKQSKAEDICKHMDNTSVLPMIRNDEEYEMVKRIALHFNFKFFMVKICFQLI